MASLQPNRPPFNLTLSALILAGCTASPPEPVETPESRFVARDVTITELRANGTAWTGTVAEASGDLDTIAVRGIRLTRPPEDPDQPPLTLEAPSGVLGLGAGVASFDEIRIRRGAGTQLTAAAARYLEDEQRVDVTGPLLLTAPGLRAHAESAVVHFDTQMIELAGPVRGTWINPRPPP